MRFPPHHLARVVFCGVVAGVVLACASRGGWVMDDREMILESPLVRGELPWWRAFDRDYMHHLGDAGQWRPLASLSLRLDHALWGAWAAGYHLTNALLHLAVVALIGALARVRAGTFLPLGTALACFAWHPALCDAYVWISGRTSMLAVLPPLAGSLWLARRAERGVARGREGVVAGLALTLGMLGKEDAVVFAPLLVLAARGEHRGTTRSVLAGISLALLAVLVARALALGEVFPRATTPALGEKNLLARLGYGGLAAWEGVKLTLWPLDFPPRYSPALLAERARGIGPQLAALLGGSTLFVALGVGARSLARGPRPLERPAVWLGMAGVAFLPYTQLLPLGEVFAPRFLYLPLLLAVPALARVLAAFEPRAAGRALLVGLPLLLGLASWKRAGIFSTRAAYQEAQLVHAPRDAASWNNLGIAHEEEGDLTRAREAFQRASVLDPHYSRAWSNLGRLALDRGDLAEARAAWERALRVGPRNAVARVNLGSLELRSGHFERAEELYLGATELAPGLDAAWRGLAQARHRAGRDGPARDALEEALRLDPADAVSRELARRLGSDAVDGETSRD